MRHYLLLTLIYTTVVINAQGNCYLYPKGSNAYKACELAHTTGELKQGSRESQQRFDSIINLNPNYAWAYFEKSVAYLKRGLITDGLKLLDKAVELDPKSHLCYRAYWFFQNRNYKMCITDLERYYALPNVYMYELTPGGDKDMRILLGLSYAKLGAIKKGIDTIESCMASYRDNSDIGFTDYHYLGLLYYLNKDYDNALVVFRKQLDITEDFPDSLYYIAMTYKALNNPKKEQLFLQYARDTFNSDNPMGNGYLCYKVYPVDVVNALDSQKTM